MGTIRLIFGIIFILYGITNLLNGLFLILGMNPPIFFGEGVENTNVLISQILPLPIFGIVTLLWGLLWIWIGNKVRTGGQAVQRFSKRK